MIVFAPPSELPLIPLLPMTPEKGAVIVLFESLAKISPLFTFALKFIGSNNSFLLILNEVVLLLREVQ